MNAIYYKALISEMTAQEFRGERKKPDRKERKWSEDFGSGRI